MAWDVDDTAVEHKQMLGSLTAADVLPYAARLHNLAPSLWDAADVASMVELLKGHSVIDYSGTVLSPQEQQLVKNFMVSWNDHVLQDARLYRLLDPFSVFFTFGHDAVPGTWADDLAAALAFISAAAGPAVGAAPIHHGAGSKPGVQDFAFTAARLTDINLLAAFLRGRHAGLNFWVVQHAAGAISYM
eukprot:TRINITY_DN4493_c0_g1_i1.p2 TRINITY_DN4493_c0_g1~~TRINITY_DN4493_c0_g1_i1.p2  ORF type:complete len:188 (+),score=42.72 TRINITY_DN4493_c0_g1_i1:145-708(+)